MAEQTVQQQQDERERKEYEEKQAKLEEAARNREVELAEPSPVDGFLSVPSAQEDVVEGSEPRANEDDSGGGDSPDPESQDKKGRK